MTRIHFGSGKSLSDPGGTNSFIIGLSGAQKSLGQRVILVDKIKLIGRPFRSSIPILEDTNLDIVNEFHFCLSFLHILLRNPNLIFRASQNIFHFHGPWYLESKFQKPKARFRNAIKFILEILILRRFKNIICVSQAFADILVSVYKIKPHCISVVPAGVDVNRFSPKTNFRSDSTKVKKIHIGTVRRLVPRMGLEILIESICYLPEYRLSIAGIGPIQNDLETLVENLGLSENVSFIGYIEENDLPDFYRSLDLCVIPSIALEGFCITALEAMACGVPVISTNIDGLKESVGQCDPKLLFEPNSIPSLISQIKFSKTRFIGDSLKFRNYALEYSWDRIAIKVEDKISGSISQNKYR